MIILGIDPGTATTGYGIIEKPEDSNQKIQIIDYGCITTKPGTPDGDRLKIINTQLNKIISQYRPDILAIENIYFFKNLKTAMPVSQAKGVILFTAAKKRIPIHEFSPPQIKMAITGYGKADKKQVQKMVQVHLELDEFVKTSKDTRWHLDDAVDALGVALCYVFNSQSKLT
tara:strand:- start:463 stop:978 length:516 start_codon:yes stop_codon:yes gene_type:complete